MTTRRLFTLAAALLALGGLSGCVNGFRADVARFHQALPPPAQGQSFVTMADNPALSGSLEFGHYADLVAQRLVDLGYVRAADPAAAQLVVRLSYGIDTGTQRLRRSPFASASLGYDPFFDFYDYPYSYHHRRRARYALGFYDSFLWGPDFDDIESFIVYRSQLRMKIDKVGGERVFEGTARAQSLSSKLTYLVPNLVDALFTGFPGQDGEDIKVTVAPEPRTQK